jgi:hypothetical protein
MTFSPAFTRIQLTEHSAFSPLLAGSLIFAHLPYLFWTSCPLLEAHLAVARDDQGVGLPRHLLTPLLLSRHF